MFIDSSSKYWKAKLVFIMNRDFDIIIQIYMLILFLFLDFENFKYV